jgi:hypothetical protein
VVWEDGGRETPSYPIASHPISAEFTLAFFKWRIALFKLPVSKNKGQDCDADVKIAVLDVEKCKYQKHQCDEERR